MTTKNELIQILAQQKESSKIFSVEFIKRGNGEVRHMTCRFGVKSFLKGGTARYNFEDYNLFCVFDMEKMAYRTINLDGLLSAKVDGKQYTVAA